MIVRVVTIVWCFSVSAGIFLMTGYAARPCDEGAPTPQWPSGSPLRLATDRPTLVLFLDPLCPCSRASLAELERSLALSRSPMAAYLIVSRNAGSVAVLPGVEIINDPQGEERRRFGVVTSGHMLLFDSIGRKAFSGGITPARGHEGDSIGGAAVIALASGSAPSASQAPVFGCPLLDDAEETLTEPAR